MNLSEYTTFSFNKNIKKIIDAMVDIIINLNILFKASFTFVFIVVNNKFKRFWYFIYAKIKNYILLKKIKTKHII